MAERTVEEFFRQVVAENAPKVETTKHKALYQAWIESERGWGTSPDGYSLHLTRQDHEVFIQQYWDSMPDNIPDKYSKPSGRSWFRKVDQSIYQQLLEARGRGEFGLRFSGKFKTNIVNSESDNPIL